MHFSIARVIHQGEGEKVQLQKALLELYKNRVVLINAKHLFNVHNVLFLYSCPILPVRCLAQQLV